MVRAEVATDAQHMFLLLAEMMFFLLTPVGVKGNLSLLELFIYFFRGIEANGELQARERANRKSLFYRNLRMGLLNVADLQYSNREGSHPVDLPGNLAELGECSLELVPYIELIWSWVESRVPNGTLVNEAKQTCGVDQRVTLCLHPGSFPPNSPAASLQTRPS